MPMKIKELLNYLNIPSSDDREISDVVASTKDVSEGCALFLMRGHNVNPVHLIDDDIRKKCALILSDQEAEGALWIPDLKRRAFELMDFVFFRFSHPFRIIGITGTEGKSSLANLIYQSLKILKKKPLLITSESGPDFFTSKMTTPDSRTIIEAMRRAESEGRSHLIMEVSCIGASEYRVSPRMFDDLFLTNLESDHLDYYENIYQYHLSKIQLMQRSVRSRKFLFRSVYDRYPHLFEKCSNLRILNDGDLRAKNLSLTHQVFLYKDQSYYTHLIFAQNRKNLALVLEYLETLNIFHPTLLIKRIRRVKGRLDLIHSRPYVMIDYAHSPSSVEAVLNELEAFRQKRMIIVIGAGGERDVKKRALYGKSCQKHGDIVFVTNDNPRGEDPLKIAQMIAVEGDEKFRIELNRKKAIRGAIEEAQNEDIVIILGRGNEEYQLIQNRKIALNDYEVAEQCFRK